MHKRFLVIGILAGGAVLLMFLAAFSCAKEEVEAVTTKPIKGFGRLEFGMNTYAAADNLPFSISYPGAYRDEYEDIIFPGDMIHSYRSVDASRWPLLQSTGATSLKVDAGFLRERLELIIITVESDDSPEKVGDALLAHIRAVYGDESTLYEGPNDDQNLESGEWEAWWSDSEGNSIDLTSSLESKTRLSYRSQSWNEYAENVPRVDGRQVDPLILATGEDQEVPTRVPIRRIGIPPGEYLIKLAISGIALVIGGTLAGFILIACVAAAWKPIKNGDVRNWEAGEPTTDQKQTMLMVYPTLVGALHEWQRRQWHVAYYVFLLLGGLIAAFTGLARTTSNLHPDIYLLGCILPGLIAVLGCFAIGLLERAAVKSRRAIWRLRSRYKDTGDYFKPLEDLPPLYTSCRYDSLSLTLIVAAIVLATFVCYLWIWAMNMLVSGGMALL